MAVVADFGDRFAFDRRGERRPARAAVIFGVAAEQGRAATGAAIHALRLVVEQRAAARRLGARFAQYAMLFGGQGPLFLAVGHDEFSMRAS